MDAILWIIVILVYGTIFAFACSHIASEKGKDPSTWAAIGFFLGIIGLIMIGFSEKESGVVMDGRKKCDKCAEVVQVEAKICRFCGYEFPPISSIRDQSELDEFPELPSSSVCIPWNNGIYEGELVNGKPQGVGLWKGNDGSIYIGNWFNGNMHGKGQLALKDGSKIIDVWLDNQRQYRQFS